MSTFAYEPQYVYTETGGFHTTVHLMENGKEIRYTKGSSRREFNLVFSSYDETGKDNIYNFFVAQSGSLEKFDWVNPNDSVTYNVRFKEGSLVTEEVDYQLYNINLTFVEVINE